MILEWLVIWVLKSARVMRVYASDDKGSSESGNVLNFVSQQQQVREDNGIADE